MLRNIITQAAHVTPKIPAPRKPLRLAHIGLAALALLIIASPTFPTSAAGPLPQAPVDVPSGSSTQAGTSLSNASSQQPQGAQPDAVCPPGGQCFTDVLPSNPFYNFINLLYMQDIVSGYACGGAGEPCDPQHRPYYRPVNNVTRQQMAKFIANARSLPQIRIQASSTDPLIYASNSSNGIGVAGSSSSYYGVAGNSNNSFGVVGGSATSSGVAGFTANGSGNWAGYFFGNVNVTGSCTGCLGSSKIDDPLDPENKYLYHSAVESPDMMDIYNGNVTTDTNGDATIQLPDWFEALNRDFRYQLTPIGQFAQAMVSSEIEENSFSIKTDKPNVKVSWQVTGIRQDPYANAHRVPVEEDKPANEQGLYLHPTEYGQPASKGINYEQEQKMEQATESNP